MDSEMGQGMVAPNPDSLSRTLQERGREIDPMRGGKRLSDDSHRALSRVI